MARFAIHSTARSEKTSGRLVIRDAVWESPLRTDGVRLTRRLACVAAVKRDKFDPADRHAQAALIIVHSQVGGPGGDGADRQLHVRNE